MENDPGLEICRRIAQIRQEVAGGRGKAAFARRLGIAPSTYDYYESDRVPPAEILAKIADLAGVDLYWLITGVSRTPSAGAMNHPAVRRAAAMLDRNPSAGAAIDGFLDLLERTAAFAKKIDVDSVVDAASPVATPKGAIAEKDIAPSADQHSSSPDTGDEISSIDVTGLIPILGRSAAGVPLFWATGENPGASKSLAEKIRHHKSRSDVAVRRAQQRDDGAAADSSVATVVFNQPVCDGICEFVSSPSLLSRWPDAFSLRIDGQSMSPEIAHGDIVVLSPSAPAIDGKCAVVQLRGQIGATCKIFRRDGKSVHLIPINETVAPIKVPATDVLWALRVLATVRVSG